MMTPQKGLSIGEVSKQTSLGVETIRFYEREGLIDEPPRKVSGYRQYSNDVIDRIRFIRRAKDIGFALKEIRELIELQRKADSPEEETLRMSKNKIAELSEKITGLSNMKQTLEDIIRRTGNGLAKDSPLIEYLNREEP